MADGGIAMDKSPSPPKIDWAKQNQAGKGSEMSGSLTDHLQRLLAIKKTNETEPPGSQDESIDGPNRVRKMLSERDEMWREHERSQIAFMEREHERTLRGLHTEIERLQIRCADITRQLSETMTIVEAKSDEENKNSEETKLIQNLQSQLKSTREELATLRDLHQRKEEKLFQLEQKCEEQEKRYKDELEQKNKQIQEIGTDLSQKAALIAQLTTQLHQLRLREAVEKQRYEQRRQMAEQQTKRRQALAASKADQSPHRNAFGKNASPSRSHTMPGKVTVQVAAEPISTPMTLQGTKKPTVRLVSATASASPTPIAQRTRSLALPSITGTSMTVSAPGPSGKSDQDQKKFVVTMKPVRSQSTMQKPSEDQ